MSATAKKEFILSDFIKRVYGVRCFHIIFFKPLKSLIFDQTGQVESLSIDDHIPCHSSNKRTSPIYSKSPDHKNALWVILLEKAFAKYNGSYASLGAGKPFEALIDLTGEIQFDNNVILRESNLYC